MNVASAVKICIVLQRTFEYRYENETHGILTREKEKIISNIRF